MYGATRHSRFATPTPTQVSIVCGRRKELEPKPNNPSRLCRCQACEARKHGDGTETASWQRRSSLLASLHSSPQRKLAQRVASSSCPTDCKHVWSSDPITQCAAVAGFELRDCMQQRHIPSPWLWRELQPAAPHTRRVQRRARELGRARARERGVKAWRFSGRRLRASAELDHHSNHLRPSSLMPGVRRRHAVLLWLIVRGLALSTASQRSQQKDALEALVLCKSKWVWLVRNALEIDARRLG